MDSSRAESWILRAPDVETKVIAGTEHVVARLGQGTSLFDRESVFGAGNWIYFKIPDREALIAVYKLGSEPSDDLSDVTTAAERVAMMAELAESAWRLAGASHAVYCRWNDPGRVYRPGPVRPDDDDA